MSPSSPSSDSSTPARMAAYAGYWKRTQFSALSDLGATPSGTSLRSLPSRSSVLKSSSSYLERAQKEWPSARFAAEGHGVITVNTPNERMPTRVGTERPHPRRVSAVSVSDSDQATFSRSYASAISTKPLFVHSEKSGDRTVEDTIETARRLPAPHLVVKSLPSRSSSRIAEAAVGHVREDLTAAQGKGHERAVWKGTHWADAAATAGQRGPTSSPCKNRGGNKTSGHTPTHQACAEIVTKGDVPLTPEPSKGDCLSGVHHAKQSSFLELPDGEMCVLDSALPDTSGGRACSTQRQEGHRDYEVLDCLPPLLQNELPSKHELRELTALQRLAVLAGLLSLLVENSQGNFQLQLNRSSHLHQEERARIETIKRNQHRSERLSREVENIEAAIDAAWAEIGNTSAMASSNLGLACNLSGSQDSTRCEPGFAHMRGGGRGSLRRRKAAARTALNSLSLDTKRHSDRLLEVQKEIVLCRGKIKEFQAHSSAVNTLEDTVKALSRFDEVVKDSEVTLHLALTVARGRQKKATDACIQHQKLYRQIVECEHHLTESIFCIHGLQDVLDASPCFLAARTVRPSSLRGQSNSDRVSKKTAESESQLNHRWETARSCFEFNMRKLRAKSIALYRQTISDDQFSSTHSMWEEEPDQPRSTATQQKMIPEPIGASSILPSQMSLSRFREIFDPADDLEIAAQPSQTGMSTQLATVNPPELTRGERRTSDLSKAALRMTNGSLSSVAVGTAVASETHVRTGADQTNRRISSAQRQGRQASASIAFEVAQRKLLGSLRNSLSASPSAATLIISMSSPLAGLPGTPGYTVEHEQELIGI